MAIPKHPSNIQRISLDTSSEPGTKQSTASPSTNQPKLSKKSLFWYVVFLLAWVLVSMIASQYIIAFPMTMLLGEAITQPLWTCVYDALVYILALILVVFVPPLLYLTYCKAHGQKNSEKPDRTKTAKPSRKSKTTELNNKSATIDSETTNPFSTNSEELGVQHLPTFVDIGLAPIGYFVYMIIATALTTVMSIFFSWFDPEQVQDVGFNFFITGSDRIIAMIALAIIAPLAEELIMRGWLYGKLRSKLKVIPAILLVSVLFGFLHGQWNVAISTFALSVVLCGLREITGTIWSGVLLHMLSNGIAFYLLYVAGM